MMGNSLSDFRDSGKVCWLGRGVEGLEKSFSINAGLCTWWVFDPVRTSEYEVCLEWKMNSPSMARGPHVKATEGMSSSGLVIGISVPCQNEINLRFKVLKPEGGGWLTVRWPVPSVECYQIMGGRGLLIISLLVNAYEMKANVWVGMID
ncbi:hypothetical protein AK812_SmicGene25483 [Symbiodinium microadriaticum]|uniref:Uncharacterized protein n=1 Tax=Symbiodinium microadriaticum TaxID=2951 RepID=A0A1Q9DBT7_SYMMI|nr:hypothetical protein AK812_SmicGene25483 [Symbiodinium microadriaticum]